MTNLFYSQVEGVPGSHTIFFFCFSFNYPILITTYFLSTILMFDFLFFHMYLSSFIYLFPYLFIYFIYLFFIYLFIYLFIIY